jgi:hypothetical protein
MSCGGRGGDRGASGHVGPARRGCAGGAEGPGASSGSPVGEDHSSCLRLPGGHGQTDDGTTRKECGPKHRAAHETRAIPMGRRPYDVRCRCGSAPGCPPSRSPAASATASASCSRSTRTASTGRLMRPTSASPTPSAPPSPSPALAMKATPAAGRQPEVAGQQPDAERNGRYTAPSDGQHTAPALAARPRPWPFLPPSVGFTAPKSGMHGRIADGGSPKSSLEARMCWSAGGDSGRRSVL